MSNGLHQPQPLYPGYPQATNPPIATTTPIAINSEAISRFIGVFAVAWYLRPSKKGKGPGHEARHGGERRHGKRCLLKFNSAELKAVLRERFESLRVRFSNCKLSRGRRPPNSPPRECLSHFNSPGKPLHSMGIDRDPLIHGLRASPHEG